VVQKKFITTLNDGWFFGIAKCNFWSVIFSLFLLAVLFVIQKKHSRFTGAIILIAGGAISNMLERIIYGGIVDYVSVGAFPVFNLADIFITGGCIVLISNAFLSSKKSPREIV
jgi:signal peptidase II